MNETTIRPATRADALAVAQVQVAAWKSAYQGCIDDELLDNLCAEEEAARWEKAIVELVPNARFLVALWENEIIGFCYGGPVKDKTTLGYDAEAYALYVLPKNQRQGVGQQLLKAFARTQIQHGAKNLILWTLKAGPSHSFYLHMGGQRPRKVASFEVGGKSHPIVAYAWIDIKKLG